MLTPAHDLKMKVCYEYKDMVVRVLEHPIARQIVILLPELVMKDNASVHAFVAYSVYHQNTASVLQ